MSEETTKDLPKLSKEAQSILDAVKTLSVLDMANLVKHMEEEFGVSAAAPVAVAAAVTAEGGEGEEAEKTDFTVELTSPGAGKINVIKAVKDILGVGLKEAKDIVDAAPKAIKENVKKEEAEEMKKKLEEAGATVELK